MYFSFENEWELKLATKIANLDSAEKYLYKNYTCGGSLVSLKDCYYFDFADRLLIANQLSFRRKIDKPSYCLKIPLGIFDGIIARREVYTSLQNCELNIHNIFHQRFPVLAEMFDVLKMEAGYFSQSELGSFMPRVHVETMRKGVRIIDRNGRRVVGAVLDKVTAKPVFGDGEGVSWLEIEVEAVSTHPDAKAMSIKIATDLSNDGWELSFESKFSKAVALLGADLYARSTIPRSRNFI